MASRLYLHAALLVVMAGGKVYFQPPASVKLEYPCIVYKRQKMDIKHADNLPYKHAKLYQITLIDTTPDSTFVDKLGLLVGIDHTTAFSNDNLNHDVYSLYY